MERDSAFNQTCTCGRTFTQLAAFKNHRRSCQKAKTRLSRVLARAKEVISAKKQIGSTFNAITGTEPLASTSVADTLGSPDLEHNQNTEISSAVPSPTTSTQLDEARPTKRRRQLPSHFRLAGLELHDKKLVDILPQPVPALPPPGMEVATSASTPPSLELCSSGTPGSSENHSAGIRAHLRRVLKTTRNSFGLFRRYHVENFPSHDPEGEVDISALSNIITMDTISGSSSSLHDTTSLHDANSSFGPFPNRSSFLLGDWFWNHGVRKSHEDFKELLGIVGDDDFKPADVRAANWAKINNQLALNDWDDEEWIDEDAGWRSSPITISVPFHRLTDNPGTRDFVVASFHRRSLVSVIRDKINNQSDHPHFHYEPYELIWQPTDDREGVRVHGEIYTSPAFIDAHNDLQDSPGEPGCNLPRIVIALMFWSDATHLTNFGNTKLWPLYMFFGNESKYRRCKPSCNLCEHVAYFEILPDSFKDFASKYTGKKKLKKEFMTHCHRELTHAQWRILLDDEFLHAYEHGIVIKCCDGVFRRFYPRIFTYSADYPEKILMASIRNMGGCPCPRCTIPKSMVHLVGTKKDRSNRIKLARVDNHQRRYMVNQARDAIYKQNLAVDSAGVERILQPQSLVPTLNAFSERLSVFGFNLFSLFVVDLMHEVELGVWRALFIHLLRILEAADENALHELDRRFRMIPTFGRDTIRRFTSNTSELKKMAARNYEDFLQCAIPVFEGLLPEPHNGRILRLLFTFAHWHGLAKLRMHTDVSLAILDDETTALGHRLRAFQSETCTVYHTCELKRESDARKRRQNKKGPTASSSVRTGHNRQDANQRQPKTLNIQTYKAHALGDYVAAIKRLGTTDSYTSEIGELEHRNPKSRYTRTSKKKFVSQLTRIERRQARIRLIRQKMTRASPSIMKNEPVSQNPEAHHHIGITENHPQHIGSFLQVHAGDPAIKDFWSKLKRHILPRIKAVLDAEMRANNSPFSSASSRSDSSQVGGVAELDGIHFKGDRIYRHNIMRINYTTYDVRRAQDTINPNTDHSNIMLLSSEYASSSNSQYISARVLGIYHVNVIYTGPGMLDYRARRIEFLWVRWFANVNNEPVQNGWARAQLDHLEFPPMNDEESFGFVDPAHVLRGSHLIQAFAMGMRNADAVGISECARDSKDWNQYYVSRFVDRDMVMRYHWGVSVGHIYGHGSAQTQETRKNTSTPLRPNHDGPDNTQREDDPEVDLNGVEKDIAEASDDEESGSDSWDNSDGSDSEDDGAYDDVELLAMDEMYGDAHEDFYD